LWGGGIRYLRELLFKKKEEEAQAQSTCAGRLCWEDPNERLA
jgi:hypothetical protein